MQLRLPVRLFPIMNPPKESSTKDTKSTNESCFCSCFSCLSWTLFFPTDQILDGMFFLRNHLSVASLRRCVRPSFWLLAVLLRLCSRATIFSHATAQRRNVKPVMMVWNRKKYKLKRDFRNCYTSRPTAALRKLFGFIVPDEPEGDAMDTR